MKQRMIEMLKFRGANAPKKLSIAGEILLCTSILSALLLLYCTLRTKPEEIDMFFSQLTTTMTASRLLSEIDGKEIHVINETPLEHQQRLDERHKLMASEVQEILSGPVYKSERAWIAASFPIEVSKLALSNWDKAEKALLNNNVGSAKPEVIDWLGAMMRASYTSTMQVKKQESRDRIWNSLIWFGITLVAFLSVLLKGVGYGLRIAREDTNRSGSAPDASTEAAALPVNVSN